MRTYRVVIGGRVLVARAATWPAALKMAGEALMADVPDAALWAFNRELYLKVKEV